MKTAKVVCLGSWPGAAKSHIEVQSRGFFKGLTSMENLRFLSLRGISRITFLPHSKPAGTVPIIEKLEKLDVQCFPKSTATWLTPESLPYLKKLDIRGGNLATLGESKWSEVKTLRLKYLNELKTTWIKLQESFPDLEYLEKVKCPGITLCPCDEHGVWMKTI